MYVLALVLKHVNSNDLRKLSLTPWTQHVGLPTTWVNSALHPSGVAKSSTSFGWGKGGNVTSAGWQVTLCDPIWHVSPVAVMAGLPANCYTPLYFYFTFI